MIDFLVLAAILVVINSIVAIGLNIQLGYTGLINLMSITCVAIGGYTTLVLCLPPANASGVNISYNDYILGLRLPFPIGVLGGMLVSGLFGFIVGAVALRRLRVYYFGIVTFCVADMTWNFIANSKLPFNGLNGTFGLQQPFIELVDPYYYNYYYLAFCLAVLVVVFIVAEILRRGSFGRLLRAIREDQDAANAFGRNVYVSQLKAFVLGSVIAGLGGGLLVGFTGALDPGGWSSGETLILLTAIFLGGTGNNIGVVLGMVLLSGVVANGITFLPHVLLRDTQQAPAQLIIYGVLLIVILRWRPVGILPEPLSRDKKLASAERIP